MSVTQKHTGDGKKTYWRFIFIFAGASKRHKLDPRDPSKRRGQYLPHPLVCCSAMHTGGGSLVSLVFYETMSSLSPKKGQDIGIHFFGGVLERGVQRGSHVARLQNTTTHGFQLIYTLGYVYCAAVKD